MLREKRSQSVEENLRLRAVKKLRMPSHLNGLELCLVRFRRIVLEIGEFGHILMQISESHRERIDFRMCFGEKNANIFRIAPAKFFRHIALQSLSSHHPTNLEVIPILSLIVILNEVRDLLFSAVSSERGVAHSL